MEDLPEALGENIPVKPFNLSKLITLLTPKENTLSKMILCILHILPL